MTLAFGRTALPRTVLVLVFVLVAVAVAALPAAGRADDHSPAATITSPAIDRAAFHASLCRLWEEHAAWTRVSVVTVAAGLPGAEVAAAPLDHARAALGDVIETVYGEGAGERFAALLGLHVAIATDLVSAARSGDDDRVEAAATRWYANAAEIADFLSGANPEPGPRETLRAALRRHLDLTRRHAEARLGGDWGADAEAYDTAYGQVREVADALFAGIVTRFPDRFE